MSPPILTPQYANDDSCLSESDARSRAGGYVFLSSRPKEALKIPLPHRHASPRDGVIHIAIGIMRNVLAYATDAELAVMFNNARDDVPLCTTPLIEMGHSQGPTSIQADNACAAGIANKTVKQRRSEAFYMPLYCI
jgi:hypothetical protein